MNLQKYIKNVAKIVSSNPWRFCTLVNAKLWSNSEEHKFSNFSFVSSSKRTFFNIGGRTWLYGFAQPANAALLYDSSMSSPSIYSQIVDSLESLMSCPVFATSSCIRTLRTIILTAPLLKLVPITSRSHNNDAVTFLSLFFVGMISFRFDVQ